MMNMTGMIAGVVAPRIIIIIFHFTGVFLKQTTGNLKKTISLSGFILSVIVFTIIFIGTFIGRYNFKTEEVDIKIKGLNKDLEGLTIVQISDLHQSCFYKNRNVLQDVMLKINSYDPDMIINTGDFISYGWREFDCNDTILAKAGSRYGNFAVLGNHDMGTYDPEYTQTDIDTNIIMMNRYITSSGYKVLNDENTIVKIGSARLGIIGITTFGRHPDIIHGDLNKAIEGLDSVDLKILLSHDPNQWMTDIVGKTDIDITLSGHTHGMQMGIMTKKIKWSPSKRYYPHWNGLFIEKNQAQYVNRGLGVLAIPFRIWMPPEITVLKLKSE